MQCNAMEKMNQV